MVGAVLPPFFCGRGGSTELVALRTMKRAIANRHMPMGDGPLPRASAKRARPRSYAACLAIPDVCAAPCRLPPPSAPRPDPHARLHHNAALADFPPGPCTCHHSPTHRRSVGRRVLGSHLFGRVKEVLELRTDTHVVGVERRFSEGSTSGREKARRKGREEIERGAKRRQRSASGAMPSNTDNADTAPR